MSDELKDGCWYLVRPDWAGGGKTAPALFKRDADAFYSYEFSGIPVRQVEVIREIEEAAPAPAPEYDFSAVFSLTHRKAQEIIARRGYKVTGFVLTDDAGRKCIVDMSAVRWFDQPAKFMHMMHDPEPTPAEMVATLLKNSPSVLAEEIVRRLGVGLPDGFQVVPSEYVKLVEGAAKIACNYSPSIDTIDENGGENAEDPTWAVHHRLHRAGLLLKEAAGKPSRGTAGD